ncbi:MAG: hypothetical protein KGJ23_09350 [Euryarchaeota archaeon]|nr:hypothetical protein [Euryarchaeota archaeon]MDE1836810.1 hypothetical protein [Euryarchaeota archaeon]MDE1881126.1 hypothetical protein [Euryarchaeota archaeon]MDE2044794.1 hypothetical protein [Thermoplasmata archaeon]
MSCPRDRIPGRPLKRLRGRRLQRSSRGVAAVVGTLLALLVFMTLFGIFLTQFLPLWMADNESMFANQVAGQLGEVKQCMDLLALYNIPGHGCSTPVTMQSGGIPVFATPTQGTLSFLQIPQLYANVSFNMSASPYGPPQPHGNTYWNNSPAEISMVLPNRYYTPVTYVITLGGLFQTQGGNQQTMLYQPSITATGTGFQQALSITLYYMYGNTTRLSSTGTNEVYVTYIQSQIWQTSNTAVNMTFDTYYPCAWQSFLGNVLKQNGIVPQFSPATCPANLGLVDQLQQMHVYFPTVPTFTFTVATFTIQMGIGNPS